MICSLSYAQDQLAPKSIYEEMFIDKNQLNEVIRLLEMDAVTWSYAEEPKQEFSVYLKLTNLHHVIKDGLVFLEGDIETIQNKPALRKINDLDQDFTIYFLDSKGQPIGQTKIKKAGKKLRFDISLPISDFIRISDFDILDGEQYPLDDNKNPFYRLYPNEFVQVDDQKFLRIHMTRKGKQKTEIERQFDQQFFYLENSSLENVLQFLKLSREMAAVYHNSRWFPHNCGEMSLVMMELMRVFQVKPIGLQVAPWVFNIKHLDQHVFLAFKVEGIVYYFDAAADQNGWRSHLHVSDRYFENFRRLAPVVIPLGAIVESYEIFRELPEDQTEHLRFEDVSSYLPKKGFPNTFRFIETDITRPLDERLDKQQIEMFLWLVQQASDKGLLEAENPASSYLGVYSIPEFAGRSPILFAA